MTRALGFDLYLITDPDVCPTLVETTARLIKAAPHGRVAVQLRAKSWTATERGLAAAQLQPVAKRCGVPFLINGDLQLARDSLASGVQLPEGQASVVEARAVLGADALLGASRHDADGLLRAQTEGADFVCLGPVFATPGKVAMGLEAFRSLTAMSRIPVLALGGIGSLNVAQVMNAGGHGIAVIREVFAAENPVHAMHALLQALDTYKDARGT